MKYGDVVLNVGGVISPCVIIAICWKVNWTEPLYKLGQNSHVLNFTF